MTNIQQQLEKEFAPIEDWHPLEVQIEISYDCTLRCAMCYNGVRANEKKFSDYIKECNFSEMSPEKHQKLKDIVENCIDEGAHFFTITGGEPLLYPDLVEDLITTIHGYGLYVSINSNATLITDTIAERLKNSGLNSALISCHGPDDDTHRKIVGVSGAWGRTISGIRSLLKVGIHVVPNFVASHANVDKMEETARMLFELGLKTQAYSMFIPTPGVESHEALKMTTADNKLYFEQLDRINRSLPGLKATATLPVPPCLSNGLVDPDVLEKFEFRTCPSGRQFMVVNSDGHASPCIQLAWNEKYGASLKDGDKMYPKLAGWKQLFNTPKKCFNCAAKGFCNPCNMNILRENKSELGADKVPYPDYFALSDDAAERFRKKFEIEVSTEGWNEPYWLVDGIEFRWECEGYVTMVNTNNQSYTVLSGVDDEDDLKKYRFRFDTPEMFQLFQAMKVIRKPPTANAPVSEMRGMGVAPKYKILTEFVGHDFNTPGVVYMTRTDTGGRFFCLPNGLQETAMYKLAMEEFAKLEEVKDESIC